MAYTREDYGAMLAQLEALGEPGYKAFHERLIPGTVMAYGVRVPAMRAMAKKIGKQDPMGFLAVGEPQSYEETMIRGMVIAGAPMPFEQRLGLVDGFLPLIGNWAVCDTFCSSFKLKKPGEREAMWQYLRPLFQSGEEFTARFAVVMFLCHYVTQDKIGEGLALLEAAPQSPYYVGMAVAWAVSVCYVKFPGETLALLRRRSLPAFTQNKAIQKIRESYRVAREDKEALLAYKV